MRHGSLIVVVILFAACTRDQHRDLVVRSVDIPALKVSAEPFLFDDDSVVYISWVEKGDSGAALKMSRLLDYAWTEPVIIASGSNWFVNWADYPMLASSGENLVAHFLERRGDAKYSYDVKLTFSSDGGQTWSDPRVLHDDNKQAEHGFVTLLPYREHFFATWLDGRNTVMDGMENMDHHEGHHGAMSLRAAILDTSGNKISEWELDNKTCDCCQTTAAITNAGPVVVYRDRSDEEIRDMSIVRLVDSVWTTPVPIHNDNWKINGCPVNGPRSASKGNALAVVWFSLASEVASVNVKFSNNGGESFGQLIRIDEGNAIGRVDIELLDEHTAIVSWMEGGEIMLTTVRDDGSNTEPTKIVTSSNARASGFPQLTEFKGTAVLAWTDDGEKTIKTVSIRL